LSIVVASTACGAPEKAPDNSPDAATADVCLPLTHAPCPLDSWEYVDTQCPDCSPGDPAPWCVDVQCTDVGDNLCYATCVTDLDCTDPCHAVCRAFDLFQGQSYPTAHGPKVCRSQ
jgi:hypothetical protein